ncbi:MAG: PEP-CTERM/exosortase system-associated acyltransferase [Gammaproteobacteria bacterium]
MDRDPDLLTHFRKYFEILRADTPALLEEAFRLRYQVYCQEGCLPGFDPLDYPDGLERDIYDYEHRSVHCLLRHRPTGSNAGTVRLVLADPVQPDALFPIEVAVGEQVDRNYLDKRCAARGTIAELLALPPCQTVPFSSGGTAMARRPGGRGPRCRSRERRAPGPNASGSGSPQGGHDHELGTAGQLLVHGNGAAAGSTAAPICIRAPACEPTDRLSWAGPRPLGLPSGSPCEYAPATSRGMVFAH